jgi:Tfp pilus assembly protein PilZ
VGGGVARAIVGARSRSGGVGVRELARGEILKVRNAISKELENNQAVIKAFYIKLFRL